MTDKLRVKYTVENDPERRFMSMFDRGRTVADFLDFVKEKQKNDDLCQVWRAGVSMPLEDIFDIWHGPEFIFQVTSEGVDPEPVADEPPAGEEGGELTGTRTTKASTRGGVQPPNPKKASYTIYTNVSEHSFKEGDTIDIEHECNVEQVKEKIEQLLRNMEGVVLPDPHELHVFLPGGLPFLNGTLYDWCPMATDVAKHNIYVVVSRPLGPSVNRVVDELADCSSDEMKRLLSPLHESTPQGYAEMACLLGYIQHGGSQTENLLKQLARVTRFAPLVCSLYRIMEQEEIIGLNVIAITGVLHTLFKSISSSVPDDTHVLDRTLQLSTIILLISGGDFLKLYASDWNDATTEDDPLEYYCKTTGQQRHFVVWLEDTLEPSIEGCNIVKMSDEQIGDIFSANPALKPVSPLTTRYLYSTVVMKGRANSMLMLGHVVGNRNEIRYIDPATGRTVTRNIEDLGREIGDREIDDVGELESERTGQVLEILFDESLSMKGDLSGHRHATRDHPELARIEIAKRFLKAFMSRTYAYRVASVFGLITFNKKFTERSRLSPIVSDFEHATADIKLGAGTCIWDVLVAAGKTIKDYSIREYDDGTQVPVHPNAVQRILVISDGRDEGSEKQPWEAAAHCIQNNIVVDSVLVATDDDNEDLAILCDVTGGLAFRVESVEQGLQLFEQEAFLNIGIRRRPRAFQGELNEASWSRKVRAFDPANGYARTAPSMALFEAESAHEISSLEYVAYLAQTKDRRPNSQRLTRIVCEVKYILNRPNDNIKVWVNRHSWDRWRVFIKGPDGTPYSGKWWSLYVTFPTHYPTCPPVVRFLSVPYHPNVSNEGRLIFSKIDEGYHSSIRVLDILTSIVELLRTPELGEPLQPLIAEAYRNRAEFDRTASRVTNEQAKANIDDYPYMKDVKREENPPERVRGDDALVNQMTVTRTRPRGGILADPQDEDAY